jgi:uncharacterized protein
VALPPFLKNQSGVVMLSVKVQPRAPRNEIGEAFGAELKIKISAPPVDSAANDELVKFLAATLDVPRSAVQLVRGATSKHKMLAIHSIGIEEVITRLQP